MIKPSLLSRTFNQLPRLTTLRTRFFLWPDSSSLGLSAVLLISGTIGSVSVKSSAQEEIPTVKNAKSRIMSNFFMI